MVLLVSSCISLSITWRAEPAGLQPQPRWVNGWMRTEVEGRVSGEGASAPTAMLNKQRQFLPHALGSYSELFDFPIHYFLRMQPPVG